MDVNQTANDVRNNIKGVKNFKDVEKLPWIYFLVAAAVLLLLMIPALLKVLTGAIIIALVAGIALAIAEYGYKKLFQVRWYYLLLPALGLGLIFYNPWWTVLIAAILVGFGFYVKYQQEKATPKV